MSEQKNELDLSAVMNMLSENPAIIGNLMSALAPKGDPPKNGSEEEKKEEEKLEGREIVVDHPAVSKWSNFWYHHKWTVMIVSFFLIVGIVCFAQCASKEKTDLSVGYAGNYVPTQEQLSGFRRTVNGMIPEDYNGDGGRAAATYVYSVFSDAELQRNSSNGDRVDSYVYQAAKKTNIEEIQNLRTFLQTGECAVWFVSEELYTETVGAGVNIAYFCRPLNELYGETAPTGAYDAYAVRLKDTAMYASYPAVQFLPEDTLVVLLRAMPMGATSDPQFYARSEALFRSIVGPQSAN